MHHSSPGHRAAHPSPMKLPIGLGVALVAAIALVLLTPLPWWAALILWLVATVCLLSVDRLSIANSTFAWITDLTPDRGQARPRALPEDQAEDEPGDERRQA